METGNNFFDPTYIHKYDLSVFLSKDGFSFIVSDENDAYLLKKNISIKHKSDSTPADQYMSIIENNNILKEDFRKKKVLYCVDKFTFVPGEFFDPSNVLDYYNFNIGELEENHSVYYNKSTESNLFTIFAFDKDLVRLVETNFPNAEFTSAIANYIDKVSPEATILGNAVFAHKRKNTLEIVIYKDNKFFAANAFSIKSDKDMAYYVLSTFNNYGFDGDVVPLLITGDLDSKSEELNLLSRYITNLLIFYEGNKWYL